jgi:hypothetical protein
MALDAVIRTLYVKGLLAVVTLAAEIPLGQFAHVHLVGTLGHLEYLVVAAGALDAFAFDMGLMAEGHWIYVLGRELDVSAADLLCKRRERQHQACNEKRDQDRSLHRKVPPYSLTTMSGIIAYRPRKTRAFFLIIMPFFAASGIIKLYFNIVLARCRYAQGKHASDHP